MRFVVVLHEAIPAQPVDFRRTQRVLLFRGYVFKNSLQPFGVGCPRHDDYVPRMQPCRKETIVKRCAIYKYIIIVVLGMVFLLSGCSLFHPGKSLIEIEQYENPMIWKEVYKMEVTLWPLERKVNKIETEYE